MIELKLYRLMFLYSIKLSFETVLYCSAKKKGEREKTIPKT